MVNRVRRRRITYLLLIPLGLTIAFILLAGGPGAASEAPPKTVVLLDSFNPKIPWSRLFHKGHLEKCLCEIKVALLLYSGLMIFGLRSSLSV